VSECLAADSADLVVEGEPPNPASWVTSPLPGARAPTAIACAAATACVVVDEVGDAISSAPAPTGGPGPGQTAAASAVTPRAAKATIGHIRVLGSSALVPVTCSGAQGSACAMAVTMTVTETRRGGRLVALGAASGHGRHSVRKVVLVGSSSAAVLAGTTKLIRVPLGHTGRNLLKAHHRLLVRLRVSQSRIQLKSVVLRFQTGSVHRHR
jgi:hypothetical protein